MTDQPVDYGHSEATATASFTKWHPREEGAPGWFSQMKMPQSTLAKIVGCKNHHLRADGRQLTHIEVTPAISTGSDPLGLTLHFQKDNELTPVSSMQQHHMYTDHSGNANADKYHAVMNGTDTVTIPVDKLETIPLEKATATAVRWDGVDPSTIADDIQKVHIKKDDGSVQTIGTFPANTAIGRLYALNKANDAFNKGVKLTAFPGDEGEHYAVSDYEHCVDKAASLSEALQDPGAHDSILATLHSVSPHRPGNINVNFKFRRNNGEAIEPIGTQAADASGRLEDKGQVKLPDGIHANVLALVDGTASECVKVEETEDGGEDQ